MRNGNPTVIVTGASRGLGAATARLVAQLGANVVLAARSETQLAGQARQIEQAGGSALVVTADVSREQDCRRVIESAVERFGSLHALVNNSGVLEPIAPLREADGQAWQYNWAVNVLGPVLLTRYALPHLSQTNGRVVNISSGVAERALPGWGAYSVAKAALNHFTRLLAEEEPAVTALSLRPGTVDTDMQAEIREQGAEGMPEEEHQRFVQYYEQGMLLQPETPGRAIACLALYAPQEWSGAFLSWDEPRLQALVDRYFP